MPRSNWKGFISFGLVSIPIMLFNSEDPASDVSFKQINRETGDRIKYKRVDIETDKEVSWENIGKGYEYEKGVILPVEEGELKRVAGENAHTIAIEEFVDKKSIDFINIEKTYYLVPDKKGEKGYVILREALKNSNKIGVAKVIISTKEYLAAIATFENALVLYLLHYHEEIRPLTDFDIPSDDIKKTKVTNKEIEIAKKLINSMSVKWNPQKYKDEFKIAVKKWADKKVNNLPAVAMPSRSRAQKSVKSADFIELLKKSLNKKPQKVKVNKKAPSKMILNKRTSHRKSLVH